MFCCFPQVDERYIMANEVQWNLDLTNCQGTREMGLYMEGSAYRASLPYILKGRALYRGVTYI